MKVEYRSTNSGGSWWLRDEDWYALERAGWKIDWVKDKKSGFYHKEGTERWLGALATSASFECETPGDAMRSFETVTGQNVADEGCNCCGAPHCFDWEKGYASGEDCLEHLFPEAEPMSLREAYERSTVKKKKS